MNLPEVFHEAFIGIAWTNGMHSAKYMYSVFRTKAGNMAHLGLHKHENLTLNPNTYTNKSQKSQMVYAYNPRTVAQGWQHMRIPGTCWPSSVAETQFQVQWGITLFQKSKVERNRGRQPLSTSDLSTQTCIHSCTYLLTYVQHMQNKNKMLLFYFYLNLWNV